MTDCFLLVLVMSQLYTVRRQSLLLTVLLTLVFVVAVPAAMLASGAAAAWPRGRVGLTLRPNAAGRGLRCTVRRPHLHTKRWGIRRHQEENKEQVTGKRNVVSVQLLSSGRLFDLFLN